MRLAIKVMMLSLVLCCTRQVLAPLDAEDEYERARSLFDSRKHEQAIQGFEKVIFYHASSEYVDDAQYWLARSYYAKKDYAQAVMEFDYLIKNFPTSQFLEDAFLHRAKSYYFNAPGYEKDQTKTREAIGHLDDFLTQFPNSRFADEAKELILTARSRLARKELENGKLYMKMHDDNAAVIYFNYILENFPETRVIPETKYCLAGIYERKGMFDEARALYQDLLEDPEWKHRAEAKIRKLDKK